MAAAAAMVANHSIRLLNVSDTAHKGLIGPQGPGGALGPPKPGFFAVLGPGRHSRGFTEPVGAILHKYQPKRSHMDLFQSIFDDFCAFSLYFAAFPGCVGGLEFAKLRPTQKIICL